MAFIIIIFFLFSYNTKVIIVILLLDGFNIGASLFCVFMGCNPFSPNHNYHWFY